MFAIRKNVPMYVHSASSFVKKDGTAGAVILFFEKENQPENIERPSKSTAPVKIWLDKLPKGVQNGSWITLLDYDIDWLHVPSQYHKGAYEDVIHLVNCKFKLYKQPEVEPAQ